MENYLLICESESGDNYYFLSNEIPSETKFDEYVKNNITEEYEDGYNYLHIEKIIRLNDLETIII